MADKLEIFISEHIQEFDTIVLSKELWGKIDATLEVKNGHKISSKCLSKFSYLGFGLSLLAVAIYVYSNNVTNTSPSIAVKTKNIFVKRHLESHPKVKQNSLESLATESKKTKEIKIFSEEEKTKIFETPLDTEENIAKGSTPLLQVKNSKSITDSSNENSGNTLSKKNKKNAFFIPEEPKTMNSYSGTLYENSSFCDLLHFYKFPGKLKFDRGNRIYKTKNLPLMKLISCGILDRMTNIKAVWLKGKTDKELKISVKNGFKNIVLLKKDGKEINPEAISHYYEGRGAISEYTGKYFTMYFTDKVGLILFFKGAEEGDEIIIDGCIKAVVIRQP